jgi:hypothetical protein
MATTQKQAYQSPEIVSLGKASELTNGMGGCAQDSAWTIPVVVPDSDDDLDIPDTF